MVLQIILHTSWTTIGPWQQINNNENNNANVNKFQYTPTWPLQNVQILYSIQIVLL